MKTHSIIFLIIIYFCFQKNIQGQSQTVPLNKTSESKMKWFGDAKLGIFIHWGIYAVNGVSESWSFHNGEISYADYMKQLQGFTADKYNPKQWADLIKESGAQYAVLTTKHHDGVALWNSKAGGINVVKDTPAKRDLIKPFTDALRANNIKVGLYFSLLDWSYTDYDHFTKDEKRYEKDKIRWNKFLNYYQTQLIEIADNYNPDLYWFDGDWEHNAKEWQTSKMRKVLLDKNPNAIINSRFAGYGDYDTPEQGVPIYKPKAKYWELCLTTNDNWGFRQSDTNYKSLNQVIDIFVDCISKGGNLLLDIGPKADGTITDNQAYILKGLGNWIKKNSVAVYGTKAGIPLAYTNYPTALSADSTTLYVYVKGNPGEAIYIKGLMNSVKTANVVSNEKSLSIKVVGKLSWSNSPGILNVSIPENTCDKDVTVIALHLDGSIKLWDTK